MPSRHPKTMRRRIPPARYGLSGEPAGSAAGAGGAGVPQDAGEPPALPGQSSKEALRSLLDTDRWTEAVQWTPSRHASVSTQSAGLRSGHKECGGRGWPTTHFRWVSSIPP